jgi:hypothetical protein
MGPYSGEYLRFDRGVNLQQAEVARKQLGCSPKEFVDIMVVDIPDEPAYLARLARVDCDVLFEGVPRNYRVNKVIDRFEKLVEAAKNARITYNELKDCRQRLRSAVLECRVAICSSEPKACRDLARRLRAQFAELKSCDLVKKARQGSSRNMQVLQDLAARRGLGIVEDIGVLASLR